MKKYSLLFLCMITLALQAAAPVEEIERLNTFSLLKNRELTGKNIKQVILYEKQRFLKKPTASKLSSLIPISVNDVAMHNKIIALVSQQYYNNNFGYSSFLTLAPISLYIPQKNPSANPSYLENYLERIHLPANHFDALRIQSINVPIGLNTVPLYLGSRAEIASPLHDFPDTTIDAFTSSIRALQLQNTNIQEILPEDLDRFPHVHTIILSESTPEEIRIQNLQQNPTIRFEYTSALKAVDELFDN